MEENYLRRQDNVILDKIPDIWTSRTNNWRFQQFISGGFNSLLLDFDVQVTAMTSQQLWTSGGGLVQRAQEPNISFGESLTSI